jgi:hypothetical protein
MMTMTDVRAAALGEFPVPPPCPPWCTTVHEARDHKRAVSWSRPHDSMSKVVQIGDSLVFVMLFVLDEYWGGRWQERKQVEIGLKVDGETIWAQRDQDKRGLLAVAGLLSPQILAAAQEATRLSSPAVTPAREDQ